MTIKIAGAPNSHPAEIITETSSKRFVTDTQIQNWTDGVIGRSLYMSLMFRRSSTVPDTPVGGSFDFPFPDGGLWTNNPLPSIDPLFVTTRLFVSDGLAPQAAVWTPPTLFVQNGSIGDTGPKGIDGLPGATGVPGADGTNGADGVNGDDGTSITWLGEAASHPLNPVDGNHYKNTTDGKSYIYWGAWYQVTIDGTDGQAGYNQAITTLYYKNTSNSVPPVAFSGTFTYTFTTATLSGGTLNGWSQTPPTIAPGEFLWVRQASAVSQTETDTIDSAEFTGAAVTSGTGTDGLNNATVYFYQKNTDGTTPPVLFSGTFIYTFATGVLSGGLLNGWSQIMPTINEGDFLWISQATASASTATDSIPTAEFSTPVILSLGSLSIVWHGDAATSDPGWEILNHAYRDTDNNAVYIWNGLAWELMVLDGSDGAAGADGVDGLSIYITYHDADPDGAAPAPPTNVAGDDNGWHTDATSAVGWMSQKVDDGTGTAWGLAIAISGSDGVDGFRGGINIIFDESTTGTVYTTPGTAAVWSGTLTDAEARNVTLDIINTFSSDGYLRPNDRITITDTSNQIAGTRVYFGEAINDIGLVASTITASDFGGLVTETIDGNLVIEGSLSATRLAADVISGGVINTTLLTGATYQTSSTYTVNGQVQVSAAENGLIVKDTLGNVRVRIGKLA